MLYPTLEECERQSIGLPVRQGWAGCGMCEIFEEREVFARAFRSKRRPVRATRRVDLLDK
jgi:hypothetical protein